ncbi:hypothetical protein A9296_05680 [Haemophilus parainfluenzae]|jgi:hypothetical protein|nr:hypothetical protein A9296_05680 [Haemophilus parainfluenzae]
MVCVNIKLGLLLIFEQAYRTDPENLSIFMHVILIIRKITQHSLILKPTNLINIYLYEKELKRLFE